MTSDQKVCARVCVCVITQHETKARRDTSSRAAKAPFPFLLAVRELADGQGVVLHPLSVKSARADRSPCLIIAANNNNNNSSQRVCDNRRCKQGRFVCTRKHLGAAQATCALQRQLRVVEFQND